MSSKIKQEKIALPSTWISLPPSFTWMKCLNFEKICKPFHDFFPLNVKGNNIYATKILLVIRANTYKIFGFSDSKVDFYTLILAGVEKPMLWSYDYSKCYEYSMKQSCPAWKIKTDTKAES